MLLAMMMCFPLVRWEPDESAWALTMTTATTMMQLLWVWVLVRQEAGESAWVWVLLLPMRPLLRRG